MVDHPLVEQYKLAVVSELTASRFRETAGWVIGYNLPGTRKALMDKDEKDAQQAYKTGQYDVALDRFCHFLALVETDPSQTIVSEMRATLTSNIGTCLHFLGQDSLATEYYERALEEFANVPLSRLSVTWLLYGNVNTKRIEYIQQRLVSLKSGKPPDGSVYQDGSGKERQWSKEEMEGRVAAWSWLNPRSWFGSNGYGSLGNESTVPTSVAAQQA